MRKTGTTVLVIDLIITRFSDCFPAVYGLPCVAAWRRRVHSLQSEHPVGC